MKQSESNTLLKIPSLKSETEIEESLMKSAHVIFDETFFHPRTEVLQKLIIDENATFWKSLLTAYEYKRIIFSLFLFFLQFHFLLPFFFFFAPSPLFPSLFF